MDLHPTSQDAEELEEDEAETDVIQTGHDRRSSMPTEAARRNRRSRILSTLNVGRMRHATADERIEALRTLREQNQATNENADQGGRTVGDRPMNRARARLSRAFGSRPASGVHGSRPSSQVPAHAAASADTPTGAETPATAEERAPELAAAIEAPTPAETTPFAGAPISSPR